MSEHVDRDRLIALRHGRLSGGDSRELLNHIATCAGCQLAAQDVLSVDAHAHEVVRSLGRKSEPVRVVRWLVAAAFLAGAVIAGTFLIQRPRGTPPPLAGKPPVVRPGRSVPAPPRPGPPERPASWEALVRDAVAARTLEVPAALLALQPAGDRFRAAAAAPQIRELHPFAEVIESDRPQFRWPLEAGATYMVLVGDKDRIVAQSPSLTTTAWQCDVALPRGRTYTWQVEIRRGETTVMLPVPPAPRARFHVIGADAKSQLDAARTAAPNDHLLLGVLLARAALRDDAIEHLTAAADQHAPGADALLASVRRWPVWRR